MRLSKRFRVTGAALAALVAAAALPVACGADDAGTSGRRIALALKVTGSAEARAPFTNAQGWTITLSKAVISTGALYYYEGATIFSMRAPPPRSPAERLWEVFGEPTAFAHPGHYIAGTAKGEYLTPSSVDLRTETPVGRGEGISGVVRSATFAFGAPAAGPFALDLGAHVAVLEGTATKAAETRIFRAEIDAADIKNTTGAIAVEGCPFVETEMTTDGVVTLTVKLGQWFDQVELDAVPVSTDGKPVLIPTSVIARNELVRGMKEGLGYSFAYGATP